MRYLTLFAKMVQNECTINKTKTNTIFRRESRKVGVIFRLDISVYINVLML